MIKNTSHAFTLNKIHKQPISTGQKIVLPPTTPQTPGK